MIRMDLRLADKSDWIRVFDPRDCTVFVPSDDPPPLGTLVRIDLAVGESGPRILLRGRVMSRRESAKPGRPLGCSVALGPKEREKINYLNGFVRGGLLDLRERRRLPLRLPVVYGAIDGPRETFTRDINEEGVFVLADDPLPETSRVHMLITVPTRGEPLSLTGDVSHTVVPEDDDIPGMGIVFTVDDQGDALTAIIDELEQAFLSGTLPEEVLL
jgi:Tfp pilus assembly protein PilZ